MIPLLVLVLAATVMATVIFVASRRVPAADPASPRAVRTAARALERGLDRGSEGWRAFARDRLDPRVGTGLLLTVGLLAMVLLGVLVFQVRTDRGIVDLDRSIESWAGDASTPFSTDVISTITDLGGTVALTVIGLVVLCVAWARTRSLRILPFLVVAIAGQAIASGLIKGLVGRPRPELGLLTGLDPSFPSGHTAGAAATLAAAALVLGRGRSSREQAMLTGLGAGLAVAVGASRVLLGVHWFSDVIGGLVLGWAWFALAALAFGGRLLRFGAPLEAAERHERLREPTAVSPR
jgi:membrane-associated phospholipid phosphatase